MNRGWILAIVFVHLWVATVDGQDGSEAEIAWVFLHDKPAGAGNRLDWQWPVDSRPDLDMPVDRDYVDQISAAGITVRVRSRWFNAVSVEATSQQLRWIQGRSFVRQLRPVGRWPRLAPPPVEESVGSGKQGGQDVDPSFQQLADIGVPALHNQGLKGAGIRVAVLDVGFNYREHPAFARLQVVAERDFINGDNIVSDQTGQPLTGNETRSSQNLHGSEVLSLLAADVPGRLVGVAPEAEYLLAKTEDLGRELPVEEDRWIAGLEWADSLGAHIVSSSLGYNIWDDGSGYSYEQLDGNTALTSQAAALAVQRGLVLVVSAGNEGDNSWRYITAPADAEGVIAVGAVQRGTDIIARFSSRGPTSDQRIKPDVVAPGGAVVVADIRSGAYKTTSGTSFSAPLVSGVCALLLQVHPSWGPQQVLQALRQTADDLGPAGPDTTFGWGRVNALRASGLEIGIPGSDLAGEPFPNPARAGTGQIHFPLQLAVASQVEVHIFDMGGQLVARLPSRWLEAGDYSRTGQALQWHMPENLANGLYLYRLIVADVKRMGKIAVVR
ncbi:MAG: S8 family serine peptidase [Candidatus Latescibacteria bacterium]|nr:S8 family serine peptidase [Candidatus Latescibacterota bacterium]